MTINWTLKPEDIEWTMQWSRFTHLRRADELVFEAEAALALLLINKVVFINSSWGETDWPKAARDSIAVCVNCNDVFAWGSADAELLPYQELESLYRSGTKIYYGAQASGV